MLGDLRAFIRFWVETYGYGLLAGLIFAALLVCCSDAPPPAKSKSECGIVSIEAGTCAGSRRPGVGITFSDGHVEVFCAPRSGEESPGI